MDDPKRKLKVGRDHLAFYLGYLEGVDLLTLCDHYMDFEPSVIKANRVAQAIREEFLIAAQRHKPSFARLMRIKPSVLGHAKIGVTLEDFRDSVDPTGTYYSEKELIELYQQEYKEDRKTKRDISLRQRIILAVRELAPMIESTPKPEDLLRYWLDEKISGWLADAPNPVITLQDLLSLIDRRGARWYKAIPKLGPTKAARIDRWLDRNGLRNGGTPLVARSNEIVPIERFEPPAALTGAAGTNRSFSNKIKADNDLEAIEAWLRSYGNRAHTVRSYRTHAERFMLWMIKEKGKALSSATIEDCTDYRDFLGDLDACGSHAEFMSMVEQGKVWRWNTTLDQWIGPRNIARRSRAWRPFSGALTASSQKLSLVVLSNMCEWLTRQKYLESNPFSGVAPAESEARIKTEHALTPEQIDIVVQAAGGLLGEYGARARFVLMLAYGTGLRLSEMTQATIFDPFQDSGLGLKQSQDGDGWDLVVIGKGNKRRTVPLSDRVISSLQDYMIYRGLGDIPGEWPAGAPLIATVDPGNRGGRRKPGLPVTQKTVSRILSQCTGLASAEATSKTDARMLSMASAHWMRHTFATHAINNGADLDAIQEILGHSSPAITSVYRNASRRRRLDAVEAVFGKNVKNTNE